MGNPEPPRPEAEVPLPGRLGPCRIVRRLGSGGTGTVFLAEMEEERPYAARGSAVAVKLLHPEVAVHRPTFERFAREARLGQALDCPGVVRVHEAITETEGERTRAFLVMEYAEGRTLRDLIEELGTLPEPLLRDLGAQIARALAAVHQAGAIHRDLKPSNVIIASGAGGEQVKLLDLGTARLAGEARLTRTGFFVGTLLYAAPEQFEGMEVGPAADLYALGVLLYEAATGFNPFDDAQLQAVIRRHLEHSPPRAGSLNPQVSPFLEELLAELLAKRPEERPGPAGTLAALFELGEASRWWSEREPRLRAAHPHGTLRRIQVRHETGVFGRERELLALVSAWDESRAGRGRLVLVEGEAGVGKSRLLEALVQRIAGQGLEFHHLHGASAPGEAGGGPGALARAVLAHLGGSGIAAALAPRFARTPRLAVPFAAFLNGEPAPSGKEALTADGLHTAFVTLARSLAGERPVLWIVEDVHFGGSPARALLASIARIAGEVPLLLVATTRPGPPFPELVPVLASSAASRIQLGRLSPAAVTELLADAFRSDTLAERLGGKIARKSDGNPYFIFEIVRELRERGLLERGPDGSWRASGEIALIEVPSSVKDLLASRLAGLGEAERALIDAGAVQGFTFDADLVARVLGRRRLEVLQALAAIERKTGVIRATGAGFAFDHHQLQEVVVTAIPPLLAAEYHALLARAFEEREGLAGREPATLPGPAAVLLADHYLRGGCRAEGTRLAPRALEHLYACYEHEAMLELGALTLQALGPEEAGARADVLFQRFRCLMLLGRSAEGAAVLKEALAAAEQAKDPARLAAVLVSVGAMHSSDSDFAEARRVLDRAIELARVAGDRRDEGRALGILADIASNAGRIDEVREHLGRQVALAQAGGDHRQEAQAEYLFAGALQQFGEPEEAAAHAERARAIAAESGDRRSEVLALGRLAMIGLRGGGVPDIRRLAEASRDLGREIGFRFGEGEGEMLLAHVELHEGDLASARAQGLRALALAEEVGHAQHLASVRLCLADVALAECRLEEARERLEPALAHARAKGVRRIEGHALGLLAELARFEGKVEESAARYAEVDALGRALGAYEIEAAGALGVGRAALERGDRGVASPALARAASLASRTSWSALPEAYRVLAGERDGATLVIAAHTPAHRRVEAHAVLHRAGAPGEHAAAARALLEKMSAHLEGEDRERFWRVHPVARMLQQ